VLTAWTLPEMDLRAVYPTARMLTAKARAFVEFIEAEFKPQPSAAT
jgi:DNA-binding transcriptional LysR family regulator